MATAQQLLRAILPFGITPDADKLMQALNVLAVAMDTTTTQASTPNYADATGTSDAILANYPSMPSLIQDGYSLIVGIPTANTTTTPTFSPTIGGVTIPPMTIVKFVNNAAVAVDIGDVQGDSWLIHDLPNQKWILKDPQVVYALSGGTVKASTVSSTGNSTFGTGVAGTGWQVGARSDNAASCLYSTSVTPSISNYALQSIGYATYLNGTSTAGITVNNGIVAQTSASGFAVTGILSSTGKLTGTSFANNIVTNAAATYAVLTTDHTIIQTTAASVYTLPAAASNTNQELHLVTQFAGTVTSASANVVPLAGGAAGTAILAATAGKFAKLQSNGTNWVIIEAN